MLPSQHRIKSGEDFRLIMRTGQRANLPEFTLFIGKEITPVARFGFVIGKPVGSAVKRNRIKRQLRAIAFGLLSKVQQRDFVIRVNPTAANSTFENLNQSLNKGLAGVLK